MKTLTFVDVDAAANANGDGNTIALHERCSGELKMDQFNNQTDLLKVLPLCDSIAWWP